MTSARPISDNPRQSQVYDQIAGSYDADLSGILAEARDVMLQQISAVLGEVSSLLDVCVGTGAGLEAIGRCVPIKHALINDLSEKMLATAVDRLSMPVTPICSEAARLAEHVPADSQQLVLSHFLYDYCDPAMVVKLAHETLEPGGYFSSVTTVKQMYDAAFWEKVHSFPLLCRLFDVDRRIALATTPDSHSAHIGLIRDQGFDVVSETPCMRRVVSDGPRAFWREVYHSGWMAGELSQYNAWELAMVRLLAWAVGVPGFGFYPVEINCHFSVVLARKRSS